MVFNEKKKSSVPYVGSFNEETVGDFLDKVLRGSKKAYPMDKIPSVIQVEPAVPGALILPVLEEEAKDEL